MLRAPLSNLAILSAALIGVKLDPSISMNRHVTELVRSCNYHIRELRHIRLLLTLQSTKMVALGIVAVRLDYCNSLLYGTSSDNLRKLQVTQNALARVVCQAATTCSATELRRQLHWLSNASLQTRRFDFKGEAERKSVISGICH